MRVRATLLFLLACTLIIPGVTAQTSIEMRYSVQISSLGSMGLAMDASREWASPDMPVYVVPVEVQGRTYYRVMAGMLATRQEAEALMSHLVARGIKESANAWDVRETNLAFALGTHASEAEALRARDEARATGVPAYVIPAEENGALTYRTWAGGFADTGESAVLQGILTGLGQSPRLMRRTGLNAASARLVMDRLAREEQARQEAARQAAAEEEAARQAAEAAAAPPPAEDPPAEETPPAAEPPEEEAPPEPSPAQRPPAQERTAPETSIPPTPVSSSGNNFTSIFVGAVGTGTQYAGAPSVSGPRGYGGAIIAGVLLGGIVELGGHGGAEYVSEDNAFGAGAATATVLSYSGFGGLYTPALGLGGVSIRLGGRGGWSQGRVRFTVADISSTADLETGVFVEPVLKIGSGSLQLIGAFRYFLDDTSAADWTGSFGFIWGT